MEESGSSKAVPQVQCTSSLPAATSLVVVPFPAVPNSLRHLCFSADCAAAGRQGATMQQQLDMQGTGAATSGTPGSECRAAASTQLQARSTRKAMTATISRSATGLLPVQPHLPLQRPLGVQGSLPAQQGSAHQRHPRRHSPVQQGPGWGRRAPVLQAPNPKDPMWPHPQPASSAEGGWGSFMTPQEMNCAASDSEEDQNGLTFATN